MAQAVILIEEGATIGQVAEKLKVSVRTVGRWVRKAKDLGANLEGTVRNNVIVKKDEEFSVLVDNYLRAAFVAWTKHLEYSEDEAWFRKQDPDKVAIFDGVHADKVFRALDAIANAQGRGSTGDEV